MANGGEGPFEFRVPGTIHVGVRCHERVGAEAARIGDGSVLAITDANVRATPMALKAEGQGRYDRGHRGRERDRHPPRLSPRWPGTAARSGTTKARAR